MLRRRTQEATSLSAQVDGEFRIVLRTQRPASGSRESIAARQTEDNRH